MRYSDHLSLRSLSSLLFCVIMCAGVVAASLFATSSHTELISFTAAPALYFVASVFFGTLTTALFIQLFRLSRAGVLARIASYLFAQVASYVQSVLDQFSERSPNSSQAVSRV